MTSATNKDVAVPGSGFVGRIPVRNLWLLMLYASGLMRTESHLDRVAAEEQPDQIPDLVARLLADAVERRLHRGLGHAYQPRSATLSRVRGRVDLFTTERRRLLEQGRIACRYFELTPDTARNRYARYALERSAKYVADQQLARRCRGLARAYAEAGVDAQRPSRAEVAADQIGRNDTMDIPVIAAATLALELAIPTEEIGQRAVAMPSRERRWIYKLFEKGVAGMYRVALVPDWHVSAGTKLNWPIEHSSDAAPELLPKMITDITLKHDATGRRIVIDTKFMPVTTLNQFGEERIRSGHLYQLYAYLRTQVSNEEPPPNDGMLLYPSIGVDVDEHVVIQGHTIRVATVDLAGSGTDIRDRLVELVDAPKGAASTVS